MKRFSFIFCVFLSLLACKNSVKNDTMLNTIDLVDPFWGSDHGNVFAGSCLPFSMMRLGPDVEIPNSTSGYISDKNIVGFSHTHLSGTGGGPRYGNIMIIPQAGRTTIVDVASLKKLNEYASAAYYQVTLARRQGDVECFLTSSEKVGFHKYVFYDWTNNDSLNANILIDVSHTNTRNALTGTRCTGANVNIVSNTEMEGEASFVGGWGGDLPYTIYFVANFNTPFDNYGTWKDTSFTANSRNAESLIIGAYARYRVKQKDEVLVKVAISFMSIAKARENMKEVPHWDFSQVQKNAERIWNEQLSKIQVKGGSPAYRKMFYSALRNTMIMPTNVTGESPEMNPSRVHYWEHYTLWDVFRSVMPLYTIIMPERQTEILNSLLDIYDKYAYLPDGWVAGHYADVQGGSNADVVFADAVVKNLPGFDREKAFEAIKKNATIQSDQPKYKGRFLNDYLKYGFITPRSTDGTVSKTLEYAYNDFCIAQVAKALGKEDEQKKYRDQSLKIFNLFHPTYKMFWAKDTTGAWLPDFSVDSKRGDSWNDPYFYEGGSITYSGYVPHDMQGLINHHGGSSFFMSYLDRVFDSGYYKLSNEPLFLLPYLYNYIGRHDKTAIRTHAIISQQFNPGRRGIPGQDDSGAMSSWFIFSSMGFFPVAGQDVYLIGSPVFDEISINVGKGKIFILTAMNLTTKNIFIKSAVLNGKKLNRSWFTHAELINGGTLELNMTDIPTNWGYEELPPSLSKAK